MTYCPIPSERCVKYKIFLKKSVLSQEYGECHAKSSRVPLWARVP